MLTIIPFPCLVHFVIVNTFPKLWLYFPGTTWVEEITYLILNDCDISKARASSIDDRVAFLEVGIPGMKAMDKLNSMTSQRLIRTHLKTSFFQKQMKDGMYKTILVLRNVKDQLVSYYHFYRMNSGFGNFTGTFDEFFELFRKGQLSYGSWFDHVLGWWQLKQQMPEKIMVVKYEDIHKDPRKMISNLAEFLGKKLSQEDVEKIAGATSFEEMKTKGNLHTKHSGMNEEISPFMRKGKVGDWQTHFSQEQSQYVDELFAKKMEGSTLSFDFK